jgi:cytochrome c-type biogenesis protein
MSELLLALFAGILTIVAPCTLPVLPILLGASIGQGEPAYPARADRGRLSLPSFAFVALALNAVATALHFDPDAVREAGLALLLIFGALMIWPDRLRAAYGSAGGCLGLSLQGRSPGSNQSGRTSSLARRSG